MNKTEKIGFKGKSREEHTENEKKIRIKKKRKNI